MNEYEVVLQLLDGENLQDMALSGDYPPRLSREYTKHLDSYRAQYFAPERDHAAKEAMRRRCVDLRNRLGMTNLELSRALGIDPSNLNDFMRNGNLGRLSRDTISRMMRWLATRVRTGEPA